MSAWDDGAGAGGCDEERGGAGRQRSGPVAGGGDLFRTLFDSHPLPMWVFDRDDSRLVAVNDAAVRMFGPGREELARIARAVDADRPPEAVPPAAVRGSAAASDRFLFQHRAEEGTPVDVEVRARDLELRGRRLRLVIAQDVTEHERARALLRSLEEPTAAAAAAAGAADLGGHAGERPAAHGRKARERVLLAEGAPGLRQVYRRLLRRADFEVVEAANGTEATAAVRDGRFDVVLADLHLPGIGGLDLIREVRRTDLDVPVVLITGMPDVESAVRAVELGAFRYLTKPIDPEALQATVRAATRAHALARLRRQALALSGASVSAADRLGLEVRFERAIEGLWMAFQPIVAVGSGSVVGMEALMRSHEPSLATPYPILDAATQLGSLALVGRRVRRLCAEALARAPQRLVLFMNLHPSNLLDPDLVDPDAPLSRLARRVVLEVTERRTLEESAQVARRLEQLRALGFRMALDDIGAGYSGLKSFTDLQPEFVKIDISLVRNLHQSGFRQRTVAALCQLCHETGSFVIGEGVESVEEHEVLIEVGCDFVQGFLFGRPVPELPRID